MLMEYAYAKVNLTLDVVKKRPDGYHDLKMIMLPLTLADELTFELSDDIHLLCDVNIEQNAVLKAAQLLKETYHITQGATITLKKKIPIGAGLGGGSADIAATLRGLNVLWDLQLSLAELEPLALKLGSDTLFCLYNKPAYVYGRGDHLLFVDAPPLSAIYLIHPDLHVSTKTVFMKHEVMHQPKKFNRLFTLYNNEKYHEFFKKTYNDLTLTTQRIYPELMAFHRVMKKVSPLARMSGSGSTYFIPVFHSNHHKIGQKIEKLGYIPVKTDVKR